MNTDENAPNTDKPIYPETLPMAADTAKRADSVDRQSRSLVRDEKPGPMKPANGKTAR